MEIGGKQILSIPELDQNLIGLQTVRGEPEMV